jgi:hypothetical protein
MGLAAPMWIFQNSTSVCCLSYWAPFTKNPPYFLAPSYIWILQQQPLHTTTKLILCWMVALQIPSSKFENLMKLWCCGPRQNMLAGNLNVQAHFELLMCKHKVFSSSHMQFHYSKNPLLPFEICLAILFCRLNIVESSNLEIVLKGALSLHNKV